MTKKRAILALIVAAGLIGGIIAYGSSAGATGYPHPDCEDHEYGNEYCTPTTVPQTTTTVKCPPKTTTTTTVVTTTTEAPPTTVVTTTTMPTETTTTLPVIENYPPPRIEEKPPTPVAVNPPEFHTVHSAPPGVTPISIAG